MTPSSWTIQRISALFIVIYLSSYQRLVQSSSTTTTATSSIRQSSAKLPTSLLSVIAELEDQGCDTFVTACLLTSQGVTQNQRSKLLKALFSIPEEETTTETANNSNKKDAIATSTAIGTSSHGGLVVALAPSSLAELDSTTDACAGTLFYYASADDLSRGEGLFHSLAAVMERLVSESDAAAAAANNNNNGDDTPTTTASVMSLSLIVLCDGEDTSKTKDLLERAALSVLSNLISNRKLSTLSDVFQSVQYVNVQQPAQLEQAVASLQKREPSLVAQSMAAPKSASSSSDGSASVLTSADLAAARLLGPAARSALNAALATVRDAMTSSATAGEDGDNLQLVTDFGKLCDAAIQRAVDDLERQASRSSAVSSSTVGKQIRANLRQELYSELGDLFDQQLELLQIASFEQFRKDLSQLRVSAILAQDMEQVITKSLSAFAKAAAKLQPKSNGGGASSWSTWPAKLEFRRRVREYSRDRLLAARASGQYKPVPRKGINLGFHWLFPKPFGNDYRQTPWMVHATDNLVYVPTDKITDVTPEDVKSGGDWRRKIVPSPAGNDMIYMQ